MSEKGKIVIVSGFSGVGKGTVVQELLRLYPQEFAVSISATTRGPRDGEVHGVHYYYMAEADFQKLLADGRLMEYNYYQGHYYGTPEAAVFEKLEQGVHVILEIDINGAFQIKAKYPQALSVFVLPPSAAALRDRLVGRGTETAEQIRGRLLQALEEAPKAVHCDTLLINDTVEACLEQLRRLVREPALAAQCYRENLPHLRQVEQDLQEMIKEI